MKNPKQICPSDDFALLPAEECNQFYLCSNGVETLLECDEGENFNPITSFCDPAYECEDNEQTTTAAITTTTPIAPTTSSPVTVSPPSDGLLDVLLPMDPCPLVGVAYRIHEQNCRLYYYCRDGIDRLQSCSVFRRFDMFTGQCMFPDDATCFPGTDVFFEIETDSDVNIID
ncbi:uncharacterized protein LOC135710386 [Ochlerotatus camptorhynchus]|uniref:uncharacterized protein LOC135710386 n=1 Tax=Ochlerotatus camptorhynchus TaxID=644619 RepID=UPI0031D01CC0